MKIGIIGLGYVGLPLVIQFAKSGTQVLGIDVDDKKVEALNRGDTQRCAGLRAHAWRTRSPSWVDESSRSCATFR